MSKRFAVAMLIALTLACAFNVTVFALRDNAMSAYVAMMLAFVVGLYVDSVMRA